MHEKAVVIWDLDETLIKSQSIMAKILGRVMPEFGIEPPKPEDIKKTYGLSLEDFLARHSQGHPNQSGIAEKFLKEQLRHYESEEIELFDGIMEAMETFALSGLKQAVVTSRGTQGRGIAGPRAVLKNAGLEKYVEVMVCGDDVKEPKPHPEGIQIALAKLDIEKPWAVMVGDQPVDMQAANEAGIFAIGIEHHEDYEHGSKLSLAGADIVVYNAQGIIRSVNELFGHY